MRFKINLVQLFAGMTMVAAVVQMLLLPRDIEPFWIRHGPLVYESPLVPEAFEMLRKDPVVIQFSPETEIQYKDPVELYTCNFEFGWKRYRALFYKDEVWNGDVHQYHFYDEYDLSKLSFRSNLDQAFLAQYHGRMACRDQIGTLLLDNSAGELRRQIAYSPNWIYAPGLFVLVCAALVCVKSNRKH